MTNEMTDRQGQGQGQRVIRFYRRNVYGNDLLYPVDYATAIYDLTGKTTLTGRTMCGLKALGFEFVEVLESQVKAKGAKQ